jgi:YVTN family beta-propeller protein
VAADGRGTVQTIDIGSHEVLKTIRIAPDAGTHGITCAADGRFLLVTDMGNSTVSIVDTTTDHVIQSIRVAAAPEGLAFLPDDTR